MAEFISNSVIMPVISLGFVLSLALTNWQLSPITLCRESPLATPVVPTRELLPQQQVHLTSSSELFPQQLLDVIILARSPK